MKTLLDPIDGIVNGIRETIFGIPAWFIGTFVALHVGFALSAIDVAGRWGSYSFISMLEHLVFCWLELIATPAGIPVLILLLIGLSSYAFSTRYRTVALIGSLITGVWHGIVLFRDNTPNEFSILFGATPKPMGVIGLTLAILLTLTSAFIGWRLIKNQPANPITG